MPLFQNYYNYKSLHSLSWLGEYLLPPSFKIIVIVVSVSEHSPITQNKDHEE